MIAESLMPMKPSRLLDDRTCRLAAKDTAPGGKHGLGRQENGKDRLPANLLVSDQALGRALKIFRPRFVGRCPLPFIWVPKASRKEKEAGLQEIEDQIAKEEGRLKEKGLPSQATVRTKKKPSPNREAVEAHVLPDHDGKP